MKVAITGTHTILGRCITHNLLKHGHRVVNLTNQQSSPFHHSHHRHLRNIPLIFQREHLVQSMEGCNALIQTYWLKPNNIYNNERHAVLDNSMMLINSAKKAKVAKVVFTSHTNPDLESPFPYIRQKAKIESYLAGSGLQYGILRLAAIFGPTVSDSVIINNIAYLVKKYRVFPIPEDGNYIMQFIHTEDFADLTLKTLLWQGSNICIDTVSPDKLTFKELVEYIARAVRADCHVVPQRSPHQMTFKARSVPWHFDELLLQNNDLQMMIKGVNQSGHPPQGKISLLKWINEHRQILGREWITPVKYYYK